MSWFCSIYFIIVSSSPVCCLIVTFLILSFLDILEDLLRASISVASTRLLLFSVIKFQCRSQWSRGVRRWSAAACLLRLWVQIPSGYGCLSVLCVCVCCQVQLSATS